MSTHHAHLTSAQGIVDQRLRGFRRNPAPLVLRVHPIGDLNRLVCIRRAFVGAAPDGGSAARSMMVKLCVQGSGAVEVRMRASQSGEISAWVAASRESTQARISSVDWSISVRFSVSSCIPLGSPSFAVGVSPVARDVQRRINIAHGSIEIRAEIGAPKVSSVDIRGLVLNKDALIPLLL
jgi:hypothetical protein